jgi:death-on-curing protein
MTRHLTLELLLRIAERACGAPVQVRDYGLLESALARSAATVFGPNAAADGSLTDVEKSAERLAGWSRPR